MLKNEPLLNTLLVNLLMGTIWHYATFFLCISIKTTHFDANKARYRPRKWERDGKWYVDHLKINQWKDLLPQYVRKDGFSKDHLDDVSLEYIDEFILETCRGEWNHIANCLFAVILFLTNTFLMAVILTVLLFLGNLPFAIIQRYNRFRLQKLKRTLVKKAERAKRLGAKNSSSLSSSENDNAADSSNIDAEGEAV